MINMINIFLIFLGAGIGGVLRYLVSYTISSTLGPSFPYGTLTVNVSGSFLIGILYILILEHAGELAPQLRSFLLMGLLGGYTTFSSFSLETVTLFEQGEWLSVFLYVFCSVFLCIVAAGLGIMGARQL